MGKLRSEDYTILSETLRQPKDHNEETGDTFEQRIKILIPEQVESNPAVFFILGNESAISNKKLIGLYEAYGRRKDMILINAEHRGYGESITADADQTKPLYVNIKQALADFHSVVLKYQSRYPGPWIAAGYSYGGGLAINFGYQYPKDAQVILSSSGVTNWDFFLDSYDIQVKENLGKGLYERLIKHVDNLGPCKPFSQSWLDRDLIYAYVTAMSQYENYNRKYKKLIDLMSLFPTKQYVGILKYIDNRFLNSSASEYAFANSKPTLSREEALSGKYSWRVWRYQQFFETGTFWKSSHSDGLYKNTLEDWIHECELLFGEAPPLLKKEKWEVGKMAGELQIPLVYVNGGKDPWKYVCLQSDYKIDNGAYIYFEDGFHCPDREPSKNNDAKKGIKVINEVFKYLAIIHS